MRKVLYILGFNRKSIVKTKIRNCLKTETVKKLIVKELKKPSSDYYKSLHAFLSYDK